jgi:hypothetical protein
VKAIYHASVPVVITVDDELAGWLLAESVRLSVPPQMLLRRGFGYPDGAQPAVKAVACRRVASGVLLAVGAYEIPVLRVLAAAYGGQAPASSVVGEVGRLVAQRLTAQDRQPLRSGELRWRYRVQFARLSLANKGYIERSAPKGIWRITPAGREHLQRAEPADTT